MLQFFHVILYQPIYNLLIFFAWIVPGHQMVWAIVAITVVIRLLLLPQSLKAAHFQVKNLELQPKINKIRSEIKDQKEQSAALMELYKQEGFSPFSSCLPLLIQLPILWILYAAFRSGLSGSGYADLYYFVPRPEAINPHFLSFDLTRPDPWVLPIIAAVIQLGLSLLMMPKKTKGQQAAENKAAEQNDPMAMMNKQMIFLPAVITVFFGRSMPSGLVIYWIVTTLFSLVQQVYINKKINAGKEKFALAQLSEPVTQETGPEKPVVPVAAKEEKKKDFMTNLMSKKLDRDEKKANVTVTIRSKKK